MLKRFCAILVILASYIATSAMANELELDWDFVELGFFEKITDADEVLFGLAVYVPGSRVASEDDFYTIIPEFCSTRLENYLNFSSQLEGAPQVSLLKLQIDFYGPKIGENETYIARSATIELDDGECSLL